MTCACWVVPHEQWAQMYRDAWRIQRAFFYNPTFDGLDIDAAEKEFANYLPGIASRDGLSFLFQEMMSYISVGHMFIRGGYVPRMDEITRGPAGSGLPHRARPLPDRAHLYAAPAGTRVSTHRSRSRDSR